jgi:hypothetical protein
MTDFDDLLEQKGTAVVSSSSIFPMVSGVPISPDEVRSRLSVQLYDQLSDGADESVVRASERAVIHVSAIFGRLGQALDLDQPVAREVALLFTVYELHMALGNEEAGREYRIKAKDLIVSSLGDYPEAANPTADKPAVGAITVPARRTYP